EVVEKVSHVGIGSGVDRCAEAEEMEGAGCRHGGLHQRAADMGIGTLERVQHDRRTAANLSGRDAGRPFKASPVRVPELEMGRLQPEALEPFEEEAEPG